MKRQIAVFLGELAEELGWEPELEDQRVRLEPETTTPVGILKIRSEPEPPARTRVASSPPDLNTEVRHLRSSLNHLSSEVTHLRAEMARLKKLPAPPDSERDASTAAESKWTPKVAESKRVTPTAAGMGDIRPWPAHLVPQPAPEPASPAREAAVEKPVPHDPVPVEPLPDPVQVEPLPDPVSVEPPQDPVPVEPLLSVEPPQDPVRSRPSPCGSPSRLSHCERQNQPHRSPPRSTPIRPWSSFPPNRDLPKTLP